jgi:two-component system NtrC family sensor kinase
MPTTQPPPSSHDIETVEQLFGQFARLEQQLAQVREALTQSHRLATLGTIASIIAHEYNNILTPIITYGQLALANDSDRELMRKAVEKSLAGAERAAHISSSLLGFAREADGNHTAHLPTVVHEAVGCMAREPQRDGIDLRLEVPDVKLAINPVDLQQILLNLLLNARHALRSQRGGRLTVSATVDGCQATISVSDNGPGVPEAIRDRLFEPFVTQRQGGGRGTGLGLCVCRDLAQNAGGSIRCDSQPGQGATFHVTLPVAEELLEANR